MLLSGSSSSLYPHFKFPFAKCPKTNVNPLANNLGKNSNIVCGKLKVLYDGYTYFNSPSHPLELELHEELQSEDNAVGIGILDFFERKNILLTGATGLLGKGLAFINLSSYTNFLISFVLLTQHD